MVKPFETEERRRQMESDLFRRKLLSPPSAISQIRRDYWPIDWKPSRPHDSRRHRSSWQLDDRIDEGETFTTLY